MMPLQAGRGHPKRSNYILRPLLAIFFIFASSSRLNAQAHHYEPVAGRMVGIWNMDWSVEYLRVLRQEYGFSGVFIFPTQAYYETAIAAGFPPTSIMAALPGDEYESFVTSYQAGFYYIDEPAEHDCYGHPSGYQLISPQDLAARTDYIHYYRPGSRFVISGYKRCSHNLLAGTNADVFMCSSYHHWSSTGLPVCHVNMGYADEWEPPWISGSDDQRDDWTDFRNELGTRFAMTWVNGGGDEYDQLFGHAANLGLEGVWVYNDAPPGPDRLEEICAAAASHGWLTRVETPPLPVQITSLSGLDLGDRRVQLKWETASELNAYGFVVERRVAEGEPFGKLEGSFVPAHGTSGDTHTYAFVDFCAMPPRCWYRLRMEDLDGFFEHSEEIAVDINEGPPPAGLTGEGVLLANYPNPFNPVTTVRFRLPQPGRVRMGVYDVLGAEVATLAEGTFEAGPYEVLWDARNMPSGVYLCRLFARSGITELRLVLLR
jgi:hypothetical protein